MIHKMRVLAIVCLVCVSIYIADAQRGPFSCRRGYRWTQCNGGCQPTCENRQPAGCLTRQCISGCVCEEGLVENSRKQCVHPDRCVRIVDQPEPSPVQVVDGYCGPNEHYESCGSTCPVTCNTPANIVCTAACRPGCQCNRDYVRDNRGTCIHRTQCPNWSPIRPL